ncbi:Hypothetical_protein [Hexamita inflata]|uniref:Hypothetical_protein n=1 Tax=Hexamita inflata TaxID=28002 RepID=A0AA86Q9I3_9EUKA|nr:Hypothetical protein HINF_LOCUS39567 [Hexamita inflata]
MNRRYSIMQDLKDNIVLMMNKLNVISKEHKNKSFQMKQKFKLFKIQQTKTNPYIDSIITTMRQQREIKLNIHINNGMKQQIITWLQHVNQIFKLKNTLYNTIQSTK